MSARLRHEKLLSDFCKAKREDKAEIKKKIDDLTVHQFRVCHTCKNEFLHKCFHDELPDPEDTICPSCKYQA